MQLLSTPPEAVCSGLVDFHNLLGGRRSLQSYAEEYLRFGIVKSARPDSRWTHLPLRNNQLQYAADDAWVALMIIWAYMNAHLGIEIESQRLQPSKKEVLLADRDARRLPEEANKKRHRVAEASGERRTLAGSFRLFVKAIRDLR